MFHVLPTNVSFRSFFLDVFLIFVLHFSPGTWIRSQILRQRGNYHTPLRLSTQAQKKLFSCYLQHLSHNYPLHLFFTTFGKKGDLEWVEHSRLERAIFTLSRLCKTQMSVNRLNGHKCNFRPFRIDCTHPSLCHFLHVSPTVNCSPEMRFLF